MAAAKPSFTTGYFLTRLLLLPIALLGLLIGIGLNLDYGLRREQPATVYDCDHTWIMVRNPLYADDQQHWYYHITTDRGNFAYDTPLPVGQPIKLLLTRFTAEPVKVREATGREGQLSSSYTRHWIWPVGLTLLSIVNLLPVFNLNHRISAGMALYVWLIMTWHFFDLLAFLG